MSFQLGELVAELARAESFEVAATAALKRLLQTAQDEVLPGVPAGARILRGMVHLRSDTAYRGLVVVDLDKGPNPQLGSDEAIPSASTWKWVARQSKAVEVDVLAGRVRPLGGEAEDLWDLGRGALETSQSQAKLLGRQTTHLFGMPLREPGGRVAGMVSVEANCLMAIGQRFDWTSAAARLQLISDVATPYLVALPLASRRGAVSTSDLLPVVGETMRSHIHLLQVFAKQDETLLLTGPTGAGKSRLARWCHAQSARAEGPFVTVDLSTRNDEMKAGELFGWKRGAFTGATSDKPGAIERASGGTLLIDEIHNLSIGAQAKLLLLLEERRYMPLGGTRERIARVRFIIGTNADLQAEVRAGRFREDLYFRCNVLPIRLLSLNERRDEVPDWASFMAAQRHASSGTGGECTVSAEAQLALQQRDYPGNLRELNNLIARAYALACIHTGANGSVEIGLRDIQHAVAFEQGGLSSPSDDEVLAALRGAAAAFVGEAMRRSSSHEPALDLDLSEALRAFILANARDRAGSREKAAVWLGKESMTRGRNHHKLFKKAGDRYEELCVALGTRPDARVLEALTGA